MARARTLDTKQQALQRSRLLHPHPEKVADPLFAGSTFFDPRDLLQVKYEMLRRVRVEAQPVAAVARAFGCSRQALYEAQAAFSSEGLAGLLPDKRGPRTAHKLAAHVVAFLQEVRSAEPGISSAALARLVQRRFRISVHPRSVERALLRTEKKHT
jgi:transposase